MSASVTWSRASGFCSWTMLRPLVRRRERVALGLLTPVAARLTSLSWRARRGTQRTISTAPKRAKTKRVKRSARAKNTNHEREPRARAKSTNQGREPRARAKGASQGREPRARAKGASQGREPRARAKGALACAASMPGNFDKKFFYLTSAAR